jgi:hypothetical protein
MLQSHAPEPGVEPHAGTDTGPCGLSFIPRDAEAPWEYQKRVNQIRQDAVQAIIRHCMDARDEHRKMQPSYLALPDGSNSRECLMAATEMIGYLDAMIEGILAECRRLT